MPTITMKGDEFGLQDSTVFLTQMPDAEPNKYLGAVCAPNGFITHVVVSTSKENPDVTDMIATTSKGKFRLHQEVRPIKLSELITALQTKLDRHGDGTVFPDKRPKIDRLFDELDSSLASALPATLLGELKRHAKKLTSGPDIPGTGRF